MAADAALAPFRAGGVRSSVRTLVGVQGRKALLGKHWEQSDLCEG